MKTILVSYLIILSSLECNLFSQAQLNRFVLSPFIEEKLDRVEESYFNLFPGVASFNQATFYMDVDSSLFINVEYYENNLLTDTLMLSTRSPQYLIDRINKVLIKDIEEARVEELEFITINKEKFEGTVYSFDNGQIKLINDGFVPLKDYTSQKDYITFLDYSKIEKIKLYKSSTDISVLFCIIGAVCGWFIGGALAPEPEPGMLDLSGLGTAFGGVLIGSLVGLVIGNTIQVPEEYDPLGSEAKRIISENSLLPSGL